MRRMRAYGKAAWASTLSPSLRAISCFTSTVRLCPFLLPRKLEQSVDLPRATHYAFLVNDDMHLISRWYWDCTPPFPLLLYLHSSLPVPGELHCPSMSPPVHCFTSPTLCTHVNATLPCCEHVFHLAPTEDPLFAFLRRVLGCTAYWSC